MKSAAQKLGVKILLADDESFMREIIANALTAGGYREIRTVSKLAQLQEVLASNYPDLLIINGEIADGDAVEFVSQVRLFRVGRNPFVPVIMTSWNSDGPFVRRVVDGGVDVLMTKPFAAGQLFSRIDFLVSGRPPFVATATYVGPDRRKSNRIVEFPQFDVPNTLRERIDGKVLDPEDLGARISKSFSSMKRQRKLMQEAEIGRLFAVVSKAMRGNEPPEDIAGVIGAMADSAERYTQEFPASTAKAADSAKALVETLQRLASTENGLSMQGCARVSELMRDMGIEIPSDPAKPAGSGSDDIYIQSGSAA